VSTVSPEEATMEADVEPVTLTELTARLADPDYPEQALKPYLTVARSPRGFGPVLLPNHNVLDANRDPLRARADLGLGFLNGAARARRRRRFERRLRSGEGAPVLIAEGDSWFQFPVWVEDVVDHLSADHNVCCLSAAGDELHNMAILKPEYAEWVARLTDDGRQLRALLISGGGNDLVGDQLSRMLRTFSPGLPAADYVDTDAFRARIARLESGYRTIFTTVRRRWPNLPILVHGYDYGKPLPAQGFQVPPRDGWTGAPMRANGIADVALQFAIVRAMIDKFNDMLSALALQFPGISYVDVRGVVGGDWRDELHATDSGFARVASRFRAALT
jgi:hypothetical protein